MTTNNSSTVCSYTYTWRSFSDGAYWRCASSLLHLPPNLPTSQPQFNISLNRRRHRCRIKPASFLSYSIPAPQPPYEHLLQSNCHTSSLGTICRIGLLSIARPRARPGMAGALILMIHSPVPTYLPGVEKEMEVNAPHRTRAVSDPRRFDNGVHRPRSSSSPLVF